MGFVLFINCVCSVVMNVVCVVGSVGGVIVGVSVVILVDCRCGNCWVSS